MNGQKKYDTYIYIYIYDRIAFNLKNVILLFFITWMNPENIMISETSQIQIDKYHMISFICDIIKV
jgi:hypothetical protein